MKNVLYGGYVIFESIIMLFAGIIWNLLKKRVKVIVLHVFPGHRFKFVPKGQVLEIIHSRQILPTRRRFEYKVLSQFIESITLGSIVLDVGANVGVFSLVASKIVGEHGRVYAVEASRNNAELLQRNLGLNGVSNVTVVNCALSNKTAKAYLADPSGLGGDAMLSLSSAKTVGAEELITKTFDSVAVELGIEKIDLIKVDIEGAELLFFQGSEQFLSRCQPIIIMECYEEFLQKNQHSIFQLLEYLSRFGYTFTEMEYCQWVARPKVDSISK